MLPLVVRNTPSTSLRRLISAASLLFFLLLSVNSLAQTKPAPAPGTLEFTGAVFSDTGQPLAGATVTVEGKALLTAIANAEGFFLLRLPIGQPTRLVVAFPSHETQLVTLNAPENEKNLVVTLHQVSKYSSDAKALRARQKKYRRSLK